MDQRWQLFAHLLVFVAILDGCIKEIHGETQVLNKCVNEEVSLDCHQLSHCLLDILSAYYGHPPAGHTAVNCTFTMGHCITNASDVWQKCHTGHSCNFLVRQARDEVRSACSTPSQYLTVTYHCSCSENCETLPALANGDISYSKDELSYGVKATFSCHGNRVLSGSSERVCERNSKWTGIQPMCSVPLSSCPVYNHSLTTSYGESCVVLSQKSITWEDARETCHTSNGTMLTTTNSSLLHYIKWWLLNNKVFGYVWLGDPGAKYKCSELFRSSSHSSDTWQIRLVDCNYKDHSICVYEPRLSQTLPFTETVTEKKVDEGVKLAVGLGIGLSLLVAAVVSVTILMLRRKACHRTRSHDSLAYSISSSNLVAQEYLYSSQGDSHQVPHLALSSIDASQASTSNQRDESNSDMYDDVCVAKKNVPSSSQTTKDINSERNGKPPVKKKPKIPLSKPRVYTTGQNNYENVTFQNLKSSLKKKFLPRKHNTTKISSISQEEKESSFIIDKSCTCTSLPVPPNRTVSNDWSRYKNGKCTICGGKEGLVELKVPSKSSDFKSALGLVVENGNTEQTVV